MVEAALRYLGLALACLGALRGPVHAERGGAIDGSPDASSPRCCPVVELRQYTLHPGQRDALIDLFDREFVESQEAEGMRIVGQFRDLDRPDRFVWIRGFSDMPARARALGAFYGGPVWKANSKAANATMVDATNVLLLRPARPAAALSLDSSRGHGPGSSGAPTSFVVATIYYLAAPANDGFLDFFGRDVTPLLTDAGADVLGEFVSEYAANTFPALPIREGEHVFVVFSSFRNVKAYERHQAALERSAAWKGRTAKALSGWLERPAEVLRLSPTSRSLLGH
jgi:quinol monooxygenase YgiN